MGYTAYAYGQITLKCGVSEEQIDNFMTRLDYLDLFTDITCEDTSIIKNKSKVNTKIISVELDWCNYDDTGLLNALDEFEGITDEGYIEYRGEDFEFWRFIFDKTNHKWKEQNGEIVYKDC